MEILVIDGQGGRIGQQLIKAILTRYPQVEVTAIGTNSLATSAMLKGGASQGATGENALLVACRRADVILGPLGIVIADALMGEISPAMAVAVGQARARRILIPLNQCDNLVAGVAELPVARLLESAVGELGKLLPPAGGAESRENRRMRQHAPGFSASLARVSSRACSRRAARGGKGAASGMP